MIIHHIAIPPDYNLSFAERNPVSGQISIQGVEPEFDIGFVDLYERSFACDTPDNLERDCYLYKAELLASTHSH